MYLVLLVTDIAPGYDHITCSYRSAVAAMNGAAFLWLGLSGRLNTWLCRMARGYPAGYHRFPRSQLTQRILDEGYSGSKDIDDRMAAARQELDWDAQSMHVPLDLKLQSDPRQQKPRKMTHSDTCSMCGKFCAVRSMNKALAGEYIDIL